MPNGIRKCMYNSGRRKTKGKSMEPSQNGNLNIFQMCFPFRTFFFHLQKKGKEKVKKNRK